MKTTVTFNAYERSEFNYKLISKTIVGEILKETPKQIVIEEKKTLSRFTIPKSKISSRMDF